MKLFFSVMLWAVFVGFGLLPESAEGADPQGNTPALQNVVIPKMHLSGVTFDDAINILQWHANRQKLSLCIRNECPPYATAQTLCNLQEENISLAEFAGKIAASAKCLCRINGNEVHFYPRFHPECGKDPIISTLICERVTLNDTINLLQTTADKNQLGIKVRNGGDADSSHQVVFSLKAENFTFGEVLNKIADCTRTIYLAEGNELVFYPRLHPITRTYSLSPAKLAARYGTSPDHLVSTLKTAGVLISVDSRFTPAKNGRSITVTAPLIVHEDMKRLEWEIRNCEITNSDSPSAEKTVHQDSAPAKKRQHSAGKKRGKNSPK